MSSKRRITVLMPVFNGVRFLNEAICSIREQIYPDFEFLIIDDGSHDGSPDILRRHAAADRRIRIITQENRGLASTLNRGLEEACGDYIARMDGDDMAVPHRLAIQMAFLESHPEITVVGGAIDVIDVSGRLGQTIRLPEAPDQIRRHMRESGCAMAHPAVIFRRRAVLELGGFRTAYRHAEDYDLWLRMLEKFDFANVPEVVLSYRRHEGAVSNKYITQQILSACCARFAAERRLRGLPDPTSDVELITPEVILRLGITLRNVELEMLRSAAADFLQDLPPYASDADARSIMVELNRNAGKLFASPE